MIDPIIDILLEQIQEKLTNAKRAWSEQIVENQSVEPTLDMMRQSDEWKREFLNKRRIKLERGHKGLVKSLVDIDRLIRELLQILPDPNLPTLLTWEEYIMPIIQNLNSADEVLEIQIYPTIQDFRTRRFPYNYPFEVQDIDDHLHNALLGLRHLVVALINWKKS
jgi:hypothetical protein